MTEYAEKVSQKQLEYAKVVREINRFKPNTLKRIILDYIGGKINQTERCRTTIFLKKSLDEVNAQEFVNTLHLFCWQFITSLEFSVLDMNEMPIKQVIAEVLEKIATTKGGLIKNLIKLFDEMITYEYAETLKKLLEKHKKPDQIEEFKVVQRKKMTSIVHKNIDIFREIFKDQSASYDITYKKDIEFKKLEKQEDIDEVNELFNALIKKASFLKTFVYSMIVYFIQFLGVDDETKEDIHDIIDETNNKIMFSSRGNLRSLCLYLVKMLNYDTLKELETIQTKYRLIDLELMQGDIQILMSEIMKKNLKSKKKQQEHPEEVGQHAQVPVDDQGYIEGFGRDTINLLHSKVYGIRELQVDLYDYASKFEKCERKGLYYSVEIINKINYWTFQNFGASERELQIDVIKVVLRKMTNSDIINHFFLLNKICLQNTLDLNQLFQLFVACLNNPDILYGDDADLPATTQMIQEEDEEDEDEDEEIDLKEFLNQTPSKGETQIEEEKVEGALQEIKEEREDVDHLQENSVIKRETKDTQGSNHETHHKNDVIDLKA